MNALLSRLPFIYLKCIWCPVLVEVPVGTKPFRVKCDPCRAESRERHRELDFERDTEEEIES
jgi:hypothetical protein